MPSVRYQPYLRLPTMAPMMGPILPMVTSASQLPPAGMPLMAGFPRVPPGFFQLPVPPVDPQGLLAAMARVQPHPSSEKLTP